MVCRLVDLSLPLNNDTRGVSITPKTTIRTHGYNTTDLLLYSHAGTHLDAPLHFIDNARTVDRLLLEKCIGPALVVDLSHKEEQSLITVEDLAPVADRVHAGSRLLFRTDWDRFANDEKYRTLFPRLSPDLATWLVDRGVWLIGVETPSVASLQDLNELQTVHRILLAGEIVIVESLANLRQLREPVVFFVALPLKIKGGDGSPVRAVALEGLPFLGLFA